MNFLDLLAGIALIWGVFRGFMNGAVKEIFSLLGLIIGIWAALRLAFVLADWYRDSVQIPANFVPLVSFLTAFAIGFVAMLLLGRLLSGMLKVAQLGLLDKLAGGVLGAARWAFFVGGLFILMGNAHILPESTPEESVSYTPLTSFSKGVYKYSFDLLPKVGNVLSDVEDYFHESDSIRNANDTLPPVDSLHTEDGPAI